VTSGYYYLYSRFEELEDHIWKMDRYAEKSLLCIRKYKRWNGFMPSCLTKLLSVLCEYIYVKMKIEEYHEFRQQQLEEVIVFWDEIEDLEKLKNHYDNLRERYLEFQEYTHMQEDRLVFCKDFLEYKLSSEQQEDVETSEVVGKSFESKSETSMSEYGQDSVRSHQSVYKSLESRFGYLHSKASSIQRKESGYADDRVSVSSVGSAVTDRGAYENKWSSEYDQDSICSDRSTATFDEDQQNESPLQNESSPSPLSDRKHQISRIPRPPPPRKAAMPEDVKGSGLPTISGHVFSRARVATEVKISNKVAGSTHHGRNTKGSSPSQMQKPSQIVLSPLQKTQYRSKQSSSNGVSYHQDSKQTTVFGQEVVARGSIKREQELKLPMIPQPPSKVNKENKKIHPSVGSQIPRLPTIQQNQGVVSGITRPPPQPPMKSRSRPGGSHRRYVTREAGIHFPRRQ